MHYKYLDIKNDINEIIAICEIIYILLYFIDLNINY